MKRLFQLTIFLLVIISASCSDKSDDLLNRTGYNMLGIRAYDKYTDSINGKLYGFSNGINSYYGYGGGYAFITGDNFASVQDGVGRLPDDYNITYLNFRNISAWSSDGAGFKWYLDENYGSSFPLLGSLSANVTGSGFSGQYVNWDMTNTDIVEGYIIADYRPLTGEEIKPSAIDIFTANDGVINYRNTLDSGYALVGISNPPANDRNLWVMAHEMNTEGEPIKSKPFMFFSIDAGINWSQPVAMSTGTDEFTNFAVISGERLIAFNEQALLRSTDGGSSWQRINFDFIGNGQNLLRVTYNRENASVLYAVVKKDQDEYGTISDIYYSADFGDSWSKLNTHDIYADNVSFYNSAVSGVAVSKNILQITSDGGKTWRVIMFPFRN